jgi:hypothetical protein
MHITPLYPEQGCPRETGNTHLNLSFPGAALKKGKEKREIH